MANIIVLDDECLSRSRLLDALHREGRHQCWGAHDLLVCAGLVESQGQTLDLLVVDVSVVEAGALDVLGLLRSACPRAGILALTHSARHPAGALYPLLRKPFTDQALVDTVDRLLSRIEAENSAGSEECGRLAQYA